MKTIFQYFKHIIFTLPFLFSGYGFCQKDTTDVDFQKQFDDFNKSITKEFQEFRSNNDSIFLKFLEDSWKEFKMFKDERIVKPKPNKQPVSTFKLEKGVEIQPRKDDIKIYEGGEIYPKLNINGNADPLEFDRIEKFDFYGSNLNSYYSKKDLPHTNGISKEAVSEFFKRAMNSERLNETIQLLKFTSDSLQQNDWGYILILKSAAKKIFNSLNDQKLFIWYALLRNQFDVKSGLDQERFYLLVNTSHDVYKTSYFIDKNKKYYHVAFEGDPEIISIIISHEADYPDANNEISLLLKEIPLFESSYLTKSLVFRGDTINIQINTNLINYYNDYPDADLSLYFSTPLSNETLDELSNLFKKKFSSSNHLQIVDMLLEFIQLSIAYKNDFDQFGYERYMFAEEALYYPYADCEDRAALLARLVNHFTGLSTVGLSYLSHVSLAVAFNEKIEGDYLFFNEKEYYICDPTYIGAKSGVGMKNLRNTQPLIIDYEK